jgi:hypothetical protein
MPYKLIIHGSKLDDYNDCPLRAFAQLMRPILIDLGYQFNEVPQYVTPNVGTAIHAGVAKLHEQKKTGVIDVSASSQVAKATLASIVEETPNLVFTKNFPNEEVISRHIDEYVAAYAKQVLPVCNAKLIEYKFEGCYTDDVCYATTLDQYTEDDILRDLKSGAHITPAMNQMGFYLLLLMQQGFQPKGVILDYMLREDKRNNAGAVIHTPITYDHTQCVNIVKNTLLALITDFRVFNETNSLKHIRINPRSDGCNNRICPLYGTTTCSGWQ